MICSEFAPISWEAGATFTTGVLAVLAAYIVGRRQNKILKKQTKIAAEMRKLEGLKTKTELFDRRLAVYVATRNWLDEFLRHAERPKNEVAANFVRAIEEAQFLYGDEMFQRLDRWRVLANSHFYHQSVFNTAAAQPGVDHPQEEANIAIRLLDEREALRETFKAALDLSDIR